MPIPQNTLEPNFLSKIGLDYYIYVYFTKISPGIYRTPLIQQDQVA